MTSKVMIVDDDNVTRKLLERLLEKNGYDCKMAYDAEQARGYLKKETFQLIISDVSMPGESGLEFVEYALSSYPDMAAIIITGMYDPEVSQKALKIGVWGFITKPFESSQVIINVANALHRRKLEMDNRSHRENLEQMVSNRTAELRKAKKNLEKAYSELKITQAKVLQQEKMASIGQLAAGVAHEINNPIGFISSNLGTLEKYVKRFTAFINIQWDVIKSFKEKDAILKVTEKQKELKLDYILEDVKYLIAESLDGADRVNKIVQDLKSFSRVDEAQYKHADVNECMETTINIVWNELKYKAKILKEYGDIPHTKCYPQQLNQVFMNLLVNAAHAIKKQGEIKIKTWHKNGKIFVSVEDTGCGIPEDKKNRIFEPFFTTKEVGKGTGLGLSISYDIVKKHNGEIMLQSKEGKGTTFIISMPVVEGR